MDYRLDIKNARMAIVRDALNGGSLDILSAQGSRLASIALEKMCGDVLVAALVFIGFPKLAMAEAGGRAAIGVLRDRTGDAVAQGLSVNTRDADIVLRNVDVEADNVIEIQSAEIRHG